MAFQLLDTTNLARFAFDTVEGLQPVLIRNLIARSIESAFGGGESSFLAEGVEKNAQNALEWYTNLSGEAREYGTLDAEERDRTNAVLAEKAEKLESEAARLLNSGSRQKKIAGRVLSRLADSVHGFLNGRPSGVKVFLVGGEPVVTGWGLIPVGKAEAFEGGISEANLNYLEQTPAAAEVPREPGAFSNVGEYAPTPPMPTAVAGAEGAFFWNLLRISLTAILTAFLLLAALYLFFPGLRDFLSPRKTFHDDGRESGLAEDLYSLREKYQFLLNGCGTEVAALELAPLPKAPLDEGAPGEDDLFDPFSVTAPAPEPPPAPKPAPKAMPKPPQAAPKPPQAAPKPPKAPDPKVGASLSIPEGGDPNDLSFMEGCWKSDAGIKESSSGRPIFDVYCFDKNGRGTLTTELYDKSGKRIDTCSTSVRVTRSKGQVKVVDNGAKCPKEGFSFTQYALTCTSESKNRTACKYRERNFTRDSRKPFDTKFTYLGKR
ncbi:MAG: hypothetical protein LBR53_04935 [Deltaproteobacteria bacterium]|jgi:hypothetical protein|nr:hypothetical protein [Deltaproteobacteria bacterium]